MEVDPGDLPSYPKMAEQVIIILLMLLHQLIQHPNYTDDNGQLQVGTGYDGVPETKLKNKEGKSWIR